LISHCIVYKNNLFHLRMTFEEFKCHAFVLLHYIQELTHSVVRWRITHVIWAVSLHYKKTEQNTTTTNFRLVRRYNMQLEHFALQRSNSFGCAMKRLHMCCCNALRTGPIIVQWRITYKLYLCIAHTPCALKS